MGEARGYFDHNATAPMTAAARAAWLEAAERRWHNPSGLYPEAALAREELEALREELAERIGVDEPERVVFFSGATEAINAVVRHLAEAVGGPLAVSEVEHPCVAAPAEAFFGGGRLRPLPTDRGSGAVDLETLAAWIRRGEVGAVAAMAANNETGALQPWGEIAALCREAGLPYLCDAVQWIGRLPLDGLGGAGYVVGSAHKFGGGKGVGFLLLPEGEEEGEVFRGLLGGPQEHGRRGGTENLPGVAAMLAALRGLDAGGLAAAAGRQASLRDAFEARIVGELGVRVLAAEGARLWNTSMFVLPRGRNVQWLARLGRRGFAVSTGSACSAGKGNPSAVMEAMGLGFEEMGRVLRVSGGPETGAEEWEGLAAALAEVAGEMG
jgi:cysteine desulfurase